MTAIYNNKSFPRCLYLYVHTIFMHGELRSGWLTDDDSAQTLPCTLHTHTHTAVVTNRVSFWNNIASLVHRLTRIKYMKESERRKKQKQIKQPPNQLDHKYHICWIYCYTLYSMGFFFSPVHFSPLNHFLLCDPRNAVAFMTAYLF